MPQIKCSLVIATYNWPVALKLCLNSVLAQTHIPDEIIIADDGSGEETKQLIANIKERSGVPLIHVWHEDKGFRKTLILNKAIKAGTAEYIIQIDGDVILDKHFVADHLISAEPKTFIRGTRAMLNKEKTDELFKSKNSRLSAFSNGVKHRNNALRIFLLRQLGSRKVMSSNSVRGSNLSFWRDDYILVNGYNNDITGWGHEDEELAARFINAGIIKKIIKLCAVQYHLYHAVLSKKDEPLQRQLVEKTKKENLAFCENGYNKTAI